MYKSILLTILLTGIIYKCSFSHSAKNNLLFIENKGQWNKNVQYMAKVDGGKVWFEKNCFTYHLYDKNAVAKNHKLKANESILPIKSHAFKLNFKSANSAQQIKITPDKIQSYFENYYLGDDKNKWQGNVRCYERIKYSNLYDGVNMIVDNEENSFKYTFYISTKSGHQIPILEFDSARSLQLKNGNLYIETSFNTIIEESPIAYQIINNKRINVPCNFVIKNKDVEFEFPVGYNKSYELVIDPIVIFSTYSGSTADNFGMSATHDNNGNLIAGGTCFAQGYPITLGAYQTTFNSLIDVVLTKYNGTGSQLLFSTYLGGSSTEVVSSIIVDSLDNVFLYGATGSSDFPTTSNAYDNTFNGGLSFSVAGNGSSFTSGSDIYIAKLNNLGTQLLGSTFIGGNDNDGVNFSDSLKYNYGDFFRGEIQINKQGNIVVVSSTKSSNFPVTPNALQPLIGGLQDAVLFSFNPALTNLLWSTFIGGLNDEAGYALAIDNTNNVVITGGTWSNNFPTTLGGTNPNYQGGRCDGFLSKIAPNGTSLLASTFIGTSSYDQSFFVQIDFLNNIYIVGQSEGLMPVLNASYSNAGSGQFIQKFDSNLSQTLYSTVFGNGSGINFSPAAFLVDVCQNVYVSGWGGNILTGIPMLNMPVTANAQQSTTDGFNFYLAVFTPNINSLLYATYYGGSQSQEHVDGGTSRFDKNGIIYQSVCAGCGSNNDFPTSPNAWSATNNSFNCNNAVFKIDFQVSPGSANFTSVLKGCSPLIVTPENIYTGNSSFYWYLDGIIVDSVNAQHVFTFTTAGTYTIKFKVQNQFCNFFDSLTRTVIVDPQPFADFNYSLISCSSSVSFVDTSQTTALPLTYDWNFGDASNSTLQNPTHNYFNTGNYNVELVITDGNTCKDTLSLPIQIDTVFNFIVNQNLFSCKKGEPISLNASGGDFYTWSPSGVLNSSVISNPIAIVDSTTSFNVEIGLLNNNGDTCKRTLSTKIIISEIDSLNYSITANPDTIFIGEQSQLNFTSDVNMNYFWNPAESLNKNDINNPIAKPITDTWYEVKVVDSLGCSFKKKILVKLLSNACEEPNIFIPNGFSPNNDKVNDILFVNGNFIETLVLKIYNRWGELIFESNNRNNGWDGTYKNKIADVGVYGYFLEAICFDGKTFFKKGNITLVR